MTKLFAVFPYYNSNKRYCQKDDGRLLCYLLYKTATPLLTMKTMKSSSRVIVTVTVLLVTAKSFSFLLLEVAAALQPSTHGQGRSCTLAESGLLRLLVILEGYLRERV